MASSAERGIQLQVIADTSFLMIPGMFGVDILSELERLLECRCEFLIPEPVVGELKRISEHGKPKEKAAAELGLQLVERGSVVEARGEADESILRLAAQKRCAVGTTDSALRRRLRKLGVITIYLRQKSHLAVDGSTG
jgi:rRNA-processing protein FCF1